MEHGSPSLTDQLAACQQRIRELEQRDAEHQAVITQQQETIAHQAAVIGQQQEAIVGFQEQLAKAAEQLRYFKRAMFGQRRERYALFSAHRVFIFLEFPGVGKSVAVVRGG